MADRIVREIHRILAAIEERLPPTRGLDRLLLPGELAELFQVEVKTLEAWRSRGLGPRFVKLGGREVRYRPRDVLEWLEKRVCSSAWAAAGLAQDAASS